MLLKWMIHRKLSAFEREHGYDASYMHEVVDRDVGAFLKFARATGLGSYRKDVPKDVHVAAGLTSSIQADCGPCTQLGVGFALQAGVPADTIAAVVKGDEAAMSPEVALARPVRARRARARRRGRRVPRGDRAPLGTARLARAGVRHHDRAALPGAEVRARPRQGLHAGRGRRPDHHTAAHAAEAA